MTNKTTFTGEVNIPSNSSYKIGGSAAPFMRVVTSTAVNTGNPGSTPTITAGGNASAGSITFAIPRGVGGQDGANGPPGTPGAQGAAGQQGPQGPPGPPGNNGATGNAGGSGGSIGTHTSQTIITSSYFKANGHAYIDNHRSYVFYAFANSHGPQGNAGTNTLYNSGFINGYYTHYTGGDDGVLVKIGHQYNAAIGLYTTQTFRSGGIMVTSDRRQKKEISTLNTETCLNKIKKIRPVSYIDKSNDRFSLGFVAQELKKEINVAVDDRGVDFIENLQILGSFSNKRSQRVHGDSTTTAKGDWNLYTFTLAEGVDWPDPMPIGLEGAPPMGKYPNGPSFLGGFPSESKKRQVEHIKFSCFKTKKDLKEYGVAVYDYKFSGAAKERSIDLLIPVKTDEYPGDEGHPRIDIDENEIYILEGTIVDDYHSINYTEVFTTLTGAVQELDKKRVSNQKRIDALESKV